LSGGEVHAVAVVVGREDCVVALGEGADWRVGAGDGGGVLGEFGRESVVSHGEVVVDGAAEEVGALRDEAEGRAAFLVGEDAGVAADQLDPPARWG
jgi:hypothetical protein